MKEVTRVIIGVIAEDLRDERERTRTRLLAEGMHPAQVAQLLQVVEEMHVGQVAQCERDVDGALGHAPVIH